MIKGEMLEWLKRHAWKACIRQKRIGGSNPPLSAVIMSSLADFQLVTTFFFPWIPKIRPVTR